MPRWADANHQGWGTSVSVKEMAGQDYCTKRGEANEDKTENGVDEAKKDRAYAVWDEANDGDERGEPGHQAGGGHQDSPPWGAVAQDQMGEGRASWR
jgi:hypothetical protein